MSNRVPGEKFISYLSSNDKKALYTGTFCFAVACAFIYRSWWLMYGETKRALPSNFPPVPNPKSKPPVKMEPDIGYDPRQKRLGHAPTQGRSSFNEEDADAQLNKSDTKIESDIKKDTKKLANSVERMATKFSSWFSD